MATNSGDKFTPPPWITKPKLENCELKVMKEGKRIQTITQIAQKPYVLFGRNAAMSDIKLEHPSISRRHALIGHGSSGNIYLMDLDSSHGTFLNSQRLKTRKRELLKDGYKIKFGASTREYIVKLDLDQEEDGKPTRHNSKKRKLDKKHHSYGDRAAKKAKVDKTQQIIDDLLRPSSWESEAITRSKDTELKAKHVDNKKAADYVLIKRDKHYEETTEGININISIENIAERIVKSIGYYATGGALASLLIDQIKDTVLTLNWSTSETKQSDEEAEEHFFVDGNYLYMALDRTITKKGTWLFSASEAVTVDLKFLYIEPKNNEDIRNLVQELKDKQAKDAFLYISNKQGWRY